MLFEKWFLPGLSNSMKNTAEKSNLNPWALKNFSEYCSFALRKSLQGIDNAMTEEVRTIERLEEIIGQLEKKAWQTIGRKIKT